MKTLFLIRHAKSDRLPGVPDFERPLSDRGLKDAPEMGRRLKRAGVLPAWFIYSPAQRTRSTAALIADELGIAPGREDRRIYEASLYDLCQVLGDIPGTAASVLVVGHNPGMYELTAWLTGIEPDAFPTCAVAGIRFKTGEWNNLQSGSGELFLFDFPKNGNGV